jgi:hypothetical protein
MSCARVGVQDNNAIAASQRIRWLILDIAINVFSKLLLKMIEEVLLRAADCWSNAFWRNISDALFVSEKMERVSCGLRQAESARDVITQWYYDTNHEPYPAVMTPSRSGFLLWVAGAMTRTNGAG